MIKMYRYDDAPQYHSLVQKGFEKSIKWFIVVPDKYDQDFIDLLENAPFFENFDISGSQLPSGEWLYQIIIL